MRLTFFEILSGNTQAPLVDSLVADNSSASVPDRAFQLDVRVWSSFKLRFAALPPA